MEEKKRPQVFVAILNQGTTQAGMETQLITWMLNLQDKYEFDFHPSEYHSRPIPSTRHMIVKDFLASGQDYLVMIDDDNPPVTNPFPLIAEDKDVIAIPTPGRDDNGLKWMVFDWGDEYPKKICFKAFPEDKRKGLQRVGAISTGWVCIKRKVLEGMKLPFEEVFDGDGVIFNSDDMGFCDKVHKAGFEIWTHFDYFCSHYKTVDLLQMVKFANMMYELGFDHGKKAAKGVKVEAVKVSDFLKNYGGANRD